VSLYCIYVRTALPSRSSNVFRSASDGSGDPSSQGCRGDGKTDLPEQLASVAEVIDSEPRRCVRTIARGERSEPLERIGNERALKGRRKILASKAHRPFRGYVLSNILARGSLRSPLGYSLTAPSGLNEKPVSRQKLTNALPFNAGRNVKRGRVRRPRPRLTDARLQYYCTSMQVVIDPSAILAVLLNEPERDALIRATISSTLITPASTPWEIGNALISGLRRKRLSRDDVSAAWNSFESISLRFVEVDISRALATAARHGLYAYDAYVLESAEAYRAPLLTLDQTLARAARRAGIALWEI
jgi:predicted nucleic acid-binding protein